MYGALARLPARKGILVGIFFLPSFGTNAAIKMVRCYDACRVRDGNGGETGTPVVAVVW